MISDVILIRTARHSETLAELAILRCPNGDLKILHARDVPRDVERVLESSPVTATHRHYKGGTYTVIGHATFEGEEMTVYVSHEGSAWCRPRAMFEGRIEDGTVRFTPLA